MGPLDPASESSLLEVLRQLAHTRIVIVVAHRAETLAACDRVHLISDRSVRASGTHPDLIKTCPVLWAYLVMGASAWQ